MINFDKFVFGYVVFNISVQDIAATVNRMLKEGINQKIDKRGRLFVPCRMVKRYVALLSGIDYSISEVKGAYGFVLKLRKRWGFIGAAIVFSLILFFSLNIIWDIRIEGCSDTLADEVSAELNNAGVNVGSLWFGIDKRSVENEILRVSDDISWISINRRGMVAYIEVIERNTHPLSQKPNGYASVVADRDCIIEEITVKTGYPLVKVGDSVRKGDVLISGVIPQSLGGGYCYAEGSVKGRYNTEIQAHSDREITDRQYLSDALYTLSVKIFNFRINIFKNCGKMPANYDIISKNKELRFLGKPIPVSVDYKIAKKYTDRTVVLDYTDMAISASNELRRILSENYCDEDLLSIKTEVRESESGYDIIASIILRAEVMQIKEFEYVSEKK